MAFATRQFQLKTIQEKAFLPGLILMVCAFASALIVAALNSDLVSAFPRLYLLPWTIGLLALFAVPSLILWKQGRLHFYDPLVFSTWVFFFPGFVIGGLVLCGGWSEPYFLTYIQDAPYNLPYTVFLMMLGYAGLSLGYLSPIGSKLGATVGAYLPTKDFDTPAIFVQGVVLTLLGTLNTAIALSFGLFGFQRHDEFEAYAGLLLLITLFWSEGAFMLLYFVFKRRSVDVYTVVALGLFVATAALRILYAGSRGAFLQVFLISILAFLLAGRRLTVRQTVIAGFVLPICLLLGMLYGTTFRNMKANESIVSVDTYTQNIFDTFDEIGRFDLASNLENAALGLAERLDVISSLAVVVSNYEALAPYEESYGLDNNIWKDFSTFFIPRVIWNDKPVASDSRKYSDLYFDYGASSWAITPIGDLVRNFGPIGVPIGMFILGIILRFVYRSLVEGQPQTVWRATVLFMILITLSWESFYGILIIFIIRIGIGAILGLFVAGTIARALGYRRVLLPA